MHGSVDDEYAVLDWGHAERRAGVAGSSLAPWPGASSSQADECLGVSAESDADKRLELLMSTAELPDLGDEVTAYFDTLAQEVFEAVVESTPRAISPPQNSNAHRSLSELLENPQLINVVNRKLGKRTLRVLQDMERHPELSVNSLCVKSAATSPFTAQEIKLKRRAALNLLDRFRSSVREKSACQDPSKDISGYRAFWDRWENILSGPDQEPLTILRRRPEFGEYWVEKFQLLHAQPDRPLASMSRVIFHPADPTLQLSDDQRCELIERMQARALEVAVEILGTADEILVVMRATESALRAKADAEEAAEARPPKKYRRLAAATLPRIPQDP